MSPVFILRALVVELDGELLYSRQEPSGGRGALDFARAFTISLDQVSTGAHEMRLAAWLETDSVVDPEARGWTFRFCSRRHFIVAAGAAIGLTALLTDTGKPDIEERPVLRFVEDHDAKPAEQKKPR